MFSKPVIYVIEERIGSTGRIVLRAASKQECQKGSAAEFRRCPLELTSGEPLYCNRLGTFISKYGNILRPCVVKPRNPRVCHTRYPFFARFGNGATCHKLVCTTFHGPRPDGYECDHLNGDINDWRADNLEWVTPSENRRRAKYLHVMRDCGFDPRIFSSKDFHYWFALPFDEFKTFFNHYKND